LQETLGDSKNIRAIKSKQNQLRHQGMPSVKAGKIAATAITGKSASKKEKKKPKDGEASDAKGPPPKVYAGGKKSGKFRAPGELNKQEKNKLKRGGKGARSFKSKAKHKRR
jgi:hypothetical protein